VLRLPRLVLEDVLDEFRAKTGAVGSRPQSLWGAKIRFAVWETSDLQAESSFRTAQAAEPLA
jgi:hypothetical protein